jgi:hypothetical protein
VRVGVTAADSNVRIDDGDLTMFNSKHGLASRPCVFTMFALRGGFRLPGIRLCRTVVFLRHSMEQK